MVPYNHIVRQPPAGAGQGSHGLDAWYRERRRDRRQPARGPQVAGRPGFSPATYGHRRSGRVGVGGLMRHDLINTGIDVIGPVPWGAHFCQFYRDKDDLLDVLIPYFKAGLENNEFCMWITSPPLGAAEARRAMGRAMPDFPGRLARGQIEILPHTRWYLKGGSFDRQRVLDGWVDKLKAAQAAGYAGLRLSGNTFWLEKEDWKSFTDYEAAINEVIGNYRMLAMCTYSLGRCGAAEIMDVVRNHEFALIRREGGWEVIESTAQKQAREALAESRSRYRGLYQAVAGGIVVQDRSGVIIQANAPARELLGLTREEISGCTSESPRWEAVCEDGSPFPGREHPAMVVLRTGRPVHAVVMGIHQPAGGRRRWILVNSEPVRDPATGSVEAVTTTFLDITGRKEAEEELAFQANILSNISDAVVAMDNDGKVTYWNRMAEEMYGIPAERAIGRHQQDLYRVAWPKPEDERDWSQEMASRGRWVGESFHIKRGGERAYVRSSMGVVRNARGEPAGVVVVVRDRTRLWQAEQDLKLLNERLRQQAEDRLRATDASFRQAIAGNADGIVVVRQDGVVRFANAAAEQLLGRGPGEMEGALFPFPLVEGAEIEISRDGGRSAIAEMRIVELEWEGAPACLATLRDITKRKQDLQALQESEARLRLFVDQIPCVTWTLDNRLRVTSYSGTGLGVIQNVPEGIKGMTLSKYFGIDDPEFEPNAAHRKALQGAPAAYEMNWTGRTFIGRVEPLRDAQERIVGVVGVAFDITGRKLAEEQLRGLSHRLVTAQENERRAIARELHDEVGQLLTALKLSLDKAASPGPVGDGSDLQEARVALRELMARVRSMSLDLRPTMLDDLGLLPTLLWHFRRYTAQTKIQVHFTHRGLRKGLSQEIITAAYRIVQEALTNVARHARVDSVSVRVRAQSGVVLVEVEDRGAGFDVESVAATSAGLNGMRERALSLKGRLLVQSRPGEGTCIIAELPLGKKRSGRKKGREDDNRGSG